MDSITLKVKTPEECKTIRKENNVVTGNKGLRGTMERRQRSVRVRVRVRVRSVTLGTCQKSSVYFWQFGWWVWVSGLPGVSVPSGSDGEQRRGG